VTSAGNPFPYLAEISEGSAGGETARIYAEIRRLTGVPFVALIYRHLATIPHALDAFWHAVAPVLESGELQEAAWRIGREAWPAPAPGLPHEVASICEADLARIADVIEAYNRANPVNFALVCLVGAAPSPGSFAARSTHRAVWSPPPAIRDIPSIPAVSELQPEVRRLVDDFAKREPSGGPMLVPTLYRHLAHWPDFLAFAHREVKPRLDAGAFQTSIDSFRSSMQSAAAGYSCDHSAHSGLLSQSVAPVLRRFGGVIPEMVVVGAFLSRTLARP